MPVIDFGTIVYLTIVTIPQIYCIEASGIGFMYYRVTTEKNFSHKIFCKFYSSSVLVSSILFSDNVLEHSRAVIFWLEILSKRSKTFSLKICLKISVDSIGDKLFECWKFIFLMVWNRGFGDKLPFIQDKIGSSIC